MFLFNKFELRFAGPLLTLLSLDNNELVMINGPAITSRIIFNIDMKLQQQQRRDDEVAAIRKIETNKQHRNLTY